MDSDDDDMLEEAKRLVLSSAELYADCLLVDQRSPPPPKPVRWRRSSAPPAPGSMARRSSAPPAPGSMALDALGSNAEAIEPIARAVLARKELEAASRALRDSTDAQKRLMKEMEVTRGAASGDPC